MTADALERQAFTLLAEIRRCIEDDLKKQALRKVDYLESLVRAGGVERTPAEELLYRAVSNCYMMAKREIARIRNGKSQTDAMSQERWEHVKRFCEDTGMKSSILRDSLPTELTEGARGAVETPAQEPLSELFERARKWLSNDDETPWQGEPRETELDARHHNDAYDLIEDLTKALQSARPSPPPAGWVKDFRDWVIQEREAERRLAEKTTAENRAIHVGRASECTDVMAMLDSFVEAASPPPATPQEWQPIETAPKDGTSFLAASPASSVFLGHWANGLVDGASWTDDGGYESRHATHWMPLPAAPHWADRNE